MVFRANPCLILQDDILGHAEIRRQLSPHGVGVGESSYLLFTNPQADPLSTATGEHAHNRMVFKQLLQANAIDVCQIDSCRLAGVNEILGVLLMAAKFGVPVVSLSFYYTSAIHQASLFPLRPVFSPPPLGALSRLWWS